MTPDSGMLNSSLSPNQPRGSKQSWAICLALAAMVFAVFGRTLGHQFIDFDDNDYVYKNPVVARGLTFQGFAWAFSFHASNWHPLTWISHMLDCQLYGMNPVGHHLSNVLIHAATAIALFLVLRSMTGSMWRSAFVAAVFAIHPLRAESVAWVAERKDVLSGLFFMLTLGAYLRCVRGGRSFASQALVMVLFALGLMAKPMLVTLPAVLLLVDYWPLRRQESWARLLVEKLPLFALSLGSCAATWLAQHGAIQVNHTVPISLRLVNGLSACAIYLRQMAFPIDLAACYPYPLGGVPLWEVALSIGVLISASALAFRRRKKYPWLWVGWSWYLVMLLPVLGLVQVGSQSHADRYTYLPEIGIAIAITWSVAEWKLAAPLLPALAAIVLVTLAGAAWKQTSYWRDSETLWTHTLACTAHNDVAEFALANTLLDNNDPDAAISHFQKSAAINPQRMLVQYNLGNALLQENRLEEAAAAYQKALAIQPTYERAEINLAITLQRQGKLGQAIAHYRAAVQLQPRYLNARIDLGMALLLNGNVDDAISQFQIALQIDPNSETARDKLKIAQAQKARR